MVFIPDPIVPEWSQEGSGENDKHLPKDPNCLVGGEQEVFGHGQNPGQHQAASVDSCLELSSASDAPAVTPAGPAPQTGPKKRGPGRPKQSEHYASFTITMPPADFERLKEQVVATGRSRSELLRLAWNGVPLTQQHEPQLDEQYHQLGQLATTLDQLRSLGQIGPLAQDQVQQVLAQVDQKMAELSGHRNP